MKPLLRVQHLTVCYCRSGARPLLALDDVTFNVAPGEVLGLLGESGCGKTTLALALLKLLPKSARVLAGSIVFRDADVFALGKDELQRLRGAGISMVHQEPALALNPVICVGDQVAEVLRAHQSISRALAKERVRTLLEHVGFTSESRIWEAFPHQLSGGQRQRVAIAQAIACDPPLVIADEPTTALDDITALEIVGLLKRLKEKLGLAVILISHDPAILAHLADRILIMYAGRVVEEGPARRVIGLPLHPYTQGLLGSRTAEHDKRRLSPVPGDPPNLTNLPAGCSFEPRCFDRMEVCQTARPNRFQAEANCKVACFKYGH